MPPKLHAHWAFYSDKVSIKNFHVLYLIVYIPTPPKWNFLTKTQCLVYAGLVLGFRILKTVLYAAFQKLPNYNENTMLHSKYSIW